LRKGVGNEEGIGKGSTAEGCRRKAGRLNDGRGGGEQRGMGGEGRRNGAELRSEGKPCNCAVGHKHVAAVGGGGRGNETRIGNR
jgi:hypothetical protein